MLHRPLSRLLPSLLASLISAGAFVGCSTARSSGSHDNDGDSDGGLDADIPNQTSPADATIDTGPSFLSLASLTISMSSAAGQVVLPLVPQFSPSVHDYYVRCTEGINPISVSMIASSGATGALVQPIKSAAAPSQTVAVNAVDGTLLGLVAAQGTTTSQYWVRCLPHDFPQLQMTSNPDAGTPDLGYYLVGNASAPEGEGGYAMVLDGNGVPLWYLKDGSSVNNVDTLTPGVVSYINNHTGLGYESHRLNPLTTSYVEIPGQVVDEHEMRVLPNGDHLVFTAPTSPGWDLTGLTLPGPDGGPETFGPNSNIRQCIINELDPSGNLVWQWTATDYFDPIKDMTYPSPPEVYPGLVVVEPFHCNSIDVDSSGNLLVSARHMDSVFYIEKSTGKVLWKMGGSSYTKDDAVFIPVTDGFYRQHDARFQPSWKPTCGGKSGSGQISMFDDETSMPNPARGVVYEVNVGGPGCADAGAPSAKVTWQYKGTESVSVTGSFRVLPGGGGIIGWGDIPNFVFTEVDVNGNDLRELHFPDGNVSYRAIKVPLTAFDPNVLRAAAGSQAPPSTGNGDSGADSGEDSGDLDVLAPGTGCYAITGTGANEQCTYTFSSMPGFTCKSIAGAAVGACPSASLYGCCVETGALDGGAQQIGATCYYSATTGQPASSQCALMTYEGMPYDWQTSAP